FDKLASVSPFRKTPYPTAEVGYGEGSGVDKRWALDVGARGVADGHQRGQLGDMARFELVECGNSEQRHGAGDLGAQDLDGAVHALAAAGHEAVEVGASDEGEVGAEGDGCDDVRAVHDAGVDHDGRLGTDLAAHLWKEVERHRRAVEL